jgi:hypothetical protein
VKVLRCISNTTLPQFRLLKKSVLAQQAAASQTVEILATNAVQSALNTSQQQRTSTSAAGLQNGAAPRRSSGVLSASLSHPRDHSTEQLPSTVHLSHRPKPPPRPRKLHTSTKIESWPASSACEAPVLLSAQTGQSNQLAISERDAPSTVNAGVANLVGASHELNLHSSSTFKAMSHSTASEESSKRRARSSANFHVDAQTPTVQSSAPYKDKSTKFYSTVAPAPVAKERASGAPLRVELHEVVVERPDAASAQIAIPSHTVLAIDSMSRSSMRTKIIVPEGFSLNPNPNQLLDLRQRNADSAAGQESERSFVSSQTYTQEIYSARNEYLQHRALAQSISPRSSSIPIGQLIAEKAAFAIDLGTSNGSKQEERSSASNVRPNYTTAVVREAAAPLNSLSNSYASVLSSFRESPRGNVSRSSSTPSTSRTRNNTTNL